MAAPASRRRAPAPAKLKSRTEFSVTLFVPASVSTATTSSASTWYRFEYKEASSTGTQWGAPHSKSVDTKPGATEVLLDDLNPTSTYEVRIYAVTRDAEGKEQLSEPSEVAAVDTEVPGCGPESSKCIVM